MSNALLTSELSGDPVTMGYAGKTAAQRADLLNDATKRPGADRHVLIADVMEYLRTRNLWLPIKAATATSQGALAAVDLNADPRAQTIDFSKPIVLAMLADLVAHTLLTQAQSDALVALKNTFVSRAQELGLTAVSEADVIVCGG